MAKVSIAREYFEGLREHSVQWLLRMLRLPKALPVEFSFRDGIDCLTNLKLIFQP